MALIKCKECDNDVSTEAAACPKCGAKVPKKSNKILTIGRNILVTIFIVWIIAQINHGTNHGATLTPQPAPAAQAAETPSGPPIEVSAAILSHDYDANEVAADQKYKGKLLKVDGVVQSINKDFENKIWVGLRTADEFTQVHADGLSQDQTINLQKGQSITVTCVGHGMILGTPVLKCS